MTKNYYHCYGDNENDNDDDETDIIISDNTNNTTILITEEEFEIGFVQSLRVQMPPLLKIDSEYQSIEVYESEHYGKVFTLDECLQLTELDAPHYNEMLAHVPVMEYFMLFPSPSKLKILVLGGGDGYVVSELLKHSEYIRTIDHVDLDRTVIDVSAKYFPWAYNLYSDNSDKVNLIIDDGANFVRERLLLKDSYYDIIIQDSSDPYFYEDDGELVVLPSNVLYSTEHFRNMYRLLSVNGGVFIFQAETYNIPSNLRSIRQWKRTLSETLNYTDVRYGTIGIPTYPTGQIGFYVAHVRTTTCEEDQCSNSDFYDWDVVTKHFNSMTGNKTKYYHPKIHKSAFDLPLWVEEAIYN
eukprot:CAMPEP_0194196786 /NCGR_PEP_ID=MMETSP0154-20130528/76856_1 /TAXON_ID=1049557 /ORGANISM="Thalassiothrix antarctica, Strain L6-D1" /LENGTH=353 /DNA_ID=CAMNT_0038921411 /DNA_START=192 /DNA_END=1253 /DNA_ORIENTATION=+